MYLIVGLGNPGRRYEETRHNVGFMTLDRLADKLGIAINRIKFKGLYGQGNYKGEKVILLKPQTYMNLSGESVMPFVNYYQIPIENVIVIVDDVDIEFGRVRVRKKGSPGTHNGLKSITQLLGDSNFPRIKIAVGQKPSYMDLAAYVLGKFTDNEKDILDKELDLAAKAALDIVSDGVEYAMNQTNPIKF